MALRGISTAPSWRGLDLDPPDAQPSAPHTALTNVTGAIDGVDHASPVLFNIATPPWPEPTTLPPTTPPPEPEPGDTREPGSITRRPDGWIDVYRGPSRGGGGLAGLATELAIAGGVFVTGALINWIRNAGNGNSGSSPPPSNGPKGSSGPSETPAPPKPMGPPAIDLPKIESQTAGQVARMPYQEINRIVPANTPQKTKLVNDVQKAHAALARAERNPQDDKALAKAQAEVARAENALRTYMKQNNPAAAAEIDALDLRPKPETQNTYRVTVGGTTITLVDNNRSAVTTRRTGLVTHGTGENVAEVIAASQAGASSKRILIATSKNEGSFTALNGFDKKGVSFGMLQFAGGAAGDLLPQLLANFKLKDPDAFGKTLGNYGIDVAGRPPELIVRRPDGSQLSGQEAADFIGSDPQLAAALAASGTNPGMQQAQIDMGLKILDSQRGQKVAGTELTIGDILTSEYANALLYDRSINLGSAGTKRRFDDIVSTYLMENPGANLSDPAVRAEIERRFIAWAEGNAADRAPALKEGTSAEPGSFVP